MVSLQPSCPIVAGAAELLSQTQINNVEQQLEKQRTNRAILWEELPKATTVKCPTDKTILWEELPKVTIEVTRNSSEEEMTMIKEMVSMVPSFPGTAMITNLPSLMLDTDDEMKTKTEAGMDLLRMCPTVSSIFEFTATAKQTNEFLLKSESTWDKPSKDYEIITTEGARHLKGHADPVEQMVDKIEYKQSTLLDTCPNVTNIAGMPFKLPVKEAKHWFINQKQIWEKQPKVKEILQSYASKDDEKNKEEMVLLVPSCPREARNPGFPSVPQNNLVFYVPNMVDIYPCCPSVSNIPGSPSISEATNRSWLSKQEPLLEKKMKTELVVMTLSPKEKDEIKRMGALVLTCPKHSCIPGIPSIPQPTIAHHGSAMMSSCPKTSSIDGIPSLMKHLSKSWATDYKFLGVTLPKFDIVMIEDRPHTKDMQAMSSLAQTCPTGFPSALECRVIYNGFSMVNILPSCPTSSSMTGFPSMKKANNKDWNTIHQPLWEKQIKKSSVLVLENKKRDKDMKGVVSLAQSCPRQSLIFGFPSVPIPKMINVDITNMVSLSNTCSKVSRIPGFPSSHNSKEWTMNRKPLFEPRMKEKQVLLFGTCERDNRAMKAMVSLVPSCPEESRMSGFPSHPNFPTVHCEPNTISLFTLCSQVSKIPGFQSVGGDLSVGWVSEKGSLLKRLPKKGIIFDTSNDNKKIMKNMVSCVPSCPKVSSIPGFPSIQNPQILHYGIHVVNLLPLCPLISIIPGLSSVEAHREERWVAELGSLMHQQLKSIQFKINRSSINIDKPKNMFTLVPSCPGASKIPGFPSVSLYNMLNLVPVCPKVSSFPGFASFERASNFQWLFDPHTVFDKPSKETVSVIHNTNQEGETVRTMLALAPSCPEASRIPGFPSAPQTKFKIESNMIRFVPCCPSASSLKGLASITTIPSTEWLNETKPIVTSFQEKRAEIIMPLAGHDQLYCYNMKAMVTLVTSCPKEARVPGFPSAQVVNRPPSTVSLYTSAPCISCVPGFPSVRMLSSEYINIQTTSKSLVAENQKLQNERIILIANFPAKHKQDEMKYMVAMAPSCPHLTQISGFPSISQLNHTEKETMTIPCPCSTEKQTSQELPHAQSTQSYLEDARIPIPSTSFSSPSTALAYGETFTVLKLRSHSPFFVLFLFVYFTLFAFMTEEKFKGRAKQNINICVDNR